MEARTLEKILGSNIAVVAAPKKSVSKTKYGEYLSFLDDSLRQYGLEHIFARRTDLGWSPAFHLISNSHKKKMFGLIPYTERTVVAVIISEPPFAIPIEDMALMKGALQIRVIDTEYFPPIQALAENYRKRFSEACFVSDEHDYNPHRNPF